MSRLPRVTATSSTPTTGQTSTCVTSASTGSAITTGAPSRTAPCTRPTASRARSHTLRFRSLRCSGVSGPPAPSDAARDYLVACDGPRGTTWWPAPPRGTTWWPAPPRATAWWPAPPPSDYVVACAAPMRRHEDPHPVRLRPERSERSDAGCSLRWFGGGHQRVVRVAGGDGHVGEAGGGQERVELGRGELFAARAEHHHGEERGRERTVARVVQEHLVEVDASAGWERGEGPRGQSRASIGVPIVQHVAEEDCVVA